MSKKIIYPAKFEEDNELGGFTVIFPDLKGCITEGETLEEAKRMASEALGVYLDTLADDKIIFPEASKIKGSNIYYIETELGQSTYTGYHKKSYEKNKSEILAKKSKSLKDKKKEGYKDFKGLFAIDTLNKLDNLVKKSGSKNRIEYISNVINKEYEKV